MKAILFDLGNVVIYLDEQQSYREFARLGGISVEEVLEKAKTAPFFHAYERGLIHSGEFRTGIRDLLACESLSDQEIDQAWNAMLIRIDPKLLDVLLEIKRKYSIMVLSNTNVIHEQAFHEMLAEVSSYSHLNELFDHVYLSQEIHQRKPDAAAWQLILAEHPGIQPDEVLFLDDRLENLEAAKSLGIQVKQIHHPGETLDLLQKII